MAGKETGPAIDTNEQKALFVKQQSVKPRLIDKMLKLYGPGPAQAICADCVNFSYHFAGRNTYFKCRLYGVTSGPATDWRKRWPACGKWCEKK